MNPSSSPDADSSKDSGAFKASLKQSVDAHRRSIVKAVCYRIYSTTITGLIVWFCTGRFVLALTVSIVESVVKIFTYFLHERIWEMIPYGRRRPTDYQI